MTPTLPWVGSLHQSRGVQGAHRRGDPQPDVSFSFTTVPPPTTLADVRGVSHISPLNGQNVSGVEGIVTARRTAGGRGVWIQDPTPDANVATSDAVFVFLNAAPVARIGDLVRASGTVSEFRAGGDPDNLTITQITSSNPNVTVLSSGNPLPAPTVLGLGGRIPPTENIDDDDAGDVETCGSFDPVNDAIDFYESVEGVILQVNNGTVVGATRSFGEITLLPDAGTWATGLRTPRGGNLLGGYVDPNPERIIVDDEILRDIAPAPRPAKPTERDCSSSSTTSARKATTSRSSARPNHRPATARPLATDRHRSSTTSSQVSSPPTRPPT